MITIIEDQERPLIWFGEPDEWPHRPGDEPCLLCESAPHTSDCTVSRIRAEKETS